MVRRKPGSFSANAHATQLSKPPPTDGDLVSWLVEPMLERAGFAIEEVSDSQPQV